MRTVGVQDSGRSAVLCSNSRGGCYCSEMQHGFRPSREAAWKTVSSLIIHLSCCIKHITCLCYQYLWSKHLCHANTPCVHYPTEIFFNQCNTLETVKALSS
ncbi:hypothetical protein DPX16_4941 [Anabarilius grahami]|uniref:Uncharacterized protein n=1 Tax=Anabarilius grahami TaxID=495550 RepID=A0A3N0XUK6_ANAGA|nr:hypothetical protein DPX16_4941 [Anabarilius grahami]